MENGIKSSIACTALTLICPGSGQLLLGRLLESFALTVLLLFGVFIICWSGIVFHNIGGVILIVWAALVYFISFLIYIFRKKYSISASRSKAVWWKISGYIFAFYFIVLTLLISKPYTLGFQVYQIPSNSMYPTFKAGELIIADTRWFKLNKFKSGDIVVFRRESRDKHFIKRVVAVAKQKLKIHEGELIVDDKIVARKVSPDFRERAMRENELFVIGDNYSRSHDSRFWGPIKEDNVVAIYKRKLFEKSEN